MHKVFIGMPVYNGAQFMAAAIDSLLSQTYTEWELLIADNNSTDKTGDIGRSYKESDPRIRYIKHETNIGAAANFLFLLNEATSNYFMWAAADDTWNKKFLECCLPGLISNKNVCLSYCNVDVIDSYDQVIRRCDSFKKFENDDKPAQISSFILDAEFSGKANLIYGVYNLDYCKKALQNSIDRYFDRWGGDMVLILGILLLPYSIVILDEYLFFKRFVSVKDIKGKPNYIGNRLPFINGIPLDKSQSKNYLMSFREVAQDTVYASLVIQLTEYRLTLAQNISDFKLGLQKSPIAFARRWLKMAIKRGN